MSSRLKILLIDDSDDVRMIYTARLNAEGFEVVTASSGAEGVQLATAQRPDFILLDLMMPNQNGMATYHALRALPALKLVPVILLTGMAIEDHWEQLPSQQDGLCFLMGKPTDLSVLFRKIQDVLKLSGRKPTGT